MCTPKPYDDINAIVGLAEKPLLMVLDGVEDPANLGAVIRTVVAAGASGVLDSGNWRAADFRRRYACGGRARWNTPTWPASPTWFEP